MINLRSKRLTIRSLKKNDWDIFYTLYSSNEVMQWIAPPFDKNYLEKDFEKKLHSKPYELEGYYTMVIEDSKFKKSIGINAYRLIDDQTVEIGIMLLPDAQRNGFATEALKLLVDYCFDHLKRSNMIALFHHKNKKAEDLLKRLNFSLVEKVPHPAYPNNQDEYCNKYELIAINSVIK